MLPAIHRSLTEIPDEVHGTSVSDGVVPAKLAPGPWRAPRLRRRFCADVPHLAAPFGRSPASIRSNAKQKHIIYGASKPNLSDW